MRCRCLFPLPTLPAPRGWSLVTHLDNIGSQLVAGRSGFAQRRRQHRVVKGILTEVQLWQWEGRGLSRSRLELIIRCGVRADDSGADDAGPEVGVPASFVAGQSAVGDQGVKI